MHREAKNVRSRETRELVRRFFVAFPFADQQECAEHTGLSRATINRHYQGLRAEQRAKRQKADA